tara:strand:- start:16234 stop:18003 length:1770 start_codon:yes stop_codon:yes gene_type:complete
MTPTRLFDFIAFKLQNQPLQSAFATKYNGIWERESTSSFYNKTIAISKALLQLGVKPDDKIAMISSNNRTEWCVTDCGILRVGAINVPIYPTISADDYEYILRHSESKYCFVSDQEVFDKIKSIQDQVPNLKKIYSYDRLEDCAHWSELLEIGDSLNNEEELIAVAEKVKPTDLATIIYTSGTTGIPKGVMLSHDNIVSNVISGSKRLPLIPTKSKALSFLPLCHVFERVLLYIYIHNSISIYFAESLETIGDNIKEVKPNTMAAVPRLLEKVYDKIYAKGEELSGIKQKLFYWAVNIGLQYEPYQQNGFWYEFKLKIARKLILSKWKEALGGNLEIIVSGSAALQVRLAKIFTAAEMTLVEGYGLTETSPIISVGDMRNKNLKMGTVGKIIEGVEVKIADDGEILCKGPNVMLGYYKQPELTKEAMSGDFFHTGDIGEIDVDGFLIITDRKKEMFKTSGGKYIAPQVLENQMKQSLFIEQIMAVGEGQKMAAAIIQPNFQFLEAWQKKEGIDSNTSKQELIKNEKLIAAIDIEIEEHNQKFAKWEQIKAYALTSEEWTVNSGHLTPTMKLKRKVIAEKYKQLIANLYA